METRNDSNRIDLIMSEKPLVSIVIPIYNGEMYLESIRKNLTEQTYDNWELLFVNDLSTDNTLQLITDFSREDSRFRVLNRREKGGTAVKGIEYAIPSCKGDYFFYMSHDDFFDNDFIQKCVMRAIESNADTVIPNLVLYKNEGSVKHGKYPLKNDYESELSAREAFLLSLDWTIHGNAFRKMSLVNKVGYKADYYNSCEFCGRKMYLEADKIVFCDTNFYYRQDNENAITKKFHYFHVDILTTDMLLYEIMRDSRYDIASQKHRLVSITKLFILWIKTYLRTPMNNTERKYVRRSLINVFNKLIRFWSEILIKKDIS